jgi:hypothetical protein
MASNTLPPGLLLPSVKGLDGPNPRDAAFMNEMNNNSKLTKLANIGGGRKKYYRGGFINPQMLATYPEIGAKGQNTTDINNKLAVISTQNTSNSSYDLKVGQVAGKTKRRNTKRLKNKTRKHKTRKNKKSRRHRK